MNQNACGSGTDGFKDEDYGSTYSNNGHSTLLFLGPSVMAAVVGGDEFKDGIIEPGLNLPTVTGAGTVIEFNHPLLADSHDRGINSDIGSIHIKRK